MIYYKYMKFKGKKFYSGRFGILTFYNYGSEGREFESLAARHLKSKPCGNLHRRAFVFFVPQGPVKNFAYLARSSGIKLFKGQQITFEGRFQSPLEDLQILKI